MTVNDGVAWQNRLEQIATTQADGEKRISSQSPAYSGDALQHEQVNCDAYRFWSYTGSERPVATKFRPRPLAQHGFSERCPRQPPPPPSCALNVVRTSNLARPWDERARSR